MGNTQKIGYVRVSTVDQHTDRQLSGLELDRMFTERASGKNVGDRPALQEMIAFIREGDEVYVHSMDRLARNLRDLLSLVEQINRKGVTLHFVTENLTFAPNAEANPMATLMLSLLGAVAQFERSLILERQREGIAKAKARGAYKGRKALNPDIIEEAKAMYNVLGMSIVSIAKELGCGKSTLYKYLKPHVENRTIRRPNLNNGGVYAPEGVWVHSHPKSTLPDEFYERLLTEKWIPIKNKKEAQE